MPERNGLIVFGTSAGATGTHAQHGRHRKSGSCNGFELHCLLLIDQIIIDKMMATTGTISLEWAESGSMTATNAAAAPWQTENQPLTPFENFHSVFVVPTDYRNKSHKVKFFVKSEN